MCSYCMCACMCMFACVYTCYAHTNCFLQLPFSPGARKKPIPMVCVISDLPGPADTWHKCPAVATGPPQSPGMSETEGSPLNSTAGERMVKNFSEETRDKMG